MLRWYVLGDTLTLFVVPRLLCRWWTSSRFIHDRTICATSVRISSHTLPGDETWGLTKVSTSAFSVTASFNTSFDRKTVLSMGDAWAYNCRGCDQDGAE